MTTVMMFGLGDLGGWVLEFLARRHGVSRIIACDVREDWGKKKVEGVATGAGQEGYDKVLKFEKCDVNNLDQTAEIICKYRPNVIYSGLTLGGWMEMRVIPRAVGAKYHRATSIITPLNVPLLHKLMQALQASGVTAHVVNNAYPDIVNPVLYRNGFPVTLGAGNHDNIVGEVRRKLSVAENVPVSEITVYFIAEHVINVLGTRTGLPYYFKAMVGDKDITKKYDVDSLLSDRPLSCPVEWTTWINHPSIATSAVRNIMAFLNDTNELAHSPGPNGLIGGYPLRINGERVEVVLPAGVSMEHAVRVNEDGARAEGVEQITEDGTLIFTDEAAGICKELYGVEVKTIPLSEMEELGKRMHAVVKELVTKYK